MSESREQDRPAVVWFRDDLRIADNPALHAAAETGRPVLCVFVWDEETPGLRAPGAASRWWLHHSLASLTESLKRLGGGLTILRGASEKTITGVLRDVDAAAVFWNRRYGGVERTIDEVVKTAARDDGREAASFAATKGIIIADTKFEFGLDDDGTLHLMDEVLTPDSSRFWPADGYRVGISPPSFDKQFVRDWLETQPWDKTPPAPRLPQDVLEKTAAKYREALDRLIA